jgi:predicted regulator of Ras-like GTPase activity (Roadblock/LC7/MglB family)
MPFADTVMYEEEFGEIHEILQRLRKAANARAAFLIDRNGQQIASTGENIEGMDSTSLASLTAGNVASTDALAKLIGEKEFSVLFHEGEKDNLHISLVGNKGILVLLFDERSSLGLVRLRVRKATGELTAIFEKIDVKAAEERAKGAAAESPFAEITDSDIDALFSSTS